MSKKYKVILNEKQIEILVESLDLYSRLPSGQFDEIFFKMLGLGKLTNRTEFEKISKQLKELYFPELSENEFYGIHQDSVSEDARIGFDMIQVLRHKLSWDKEPEGGITVNFHEPMKTSTKENLIEIKDV